MIFSPGSPFARRLRSESSSIRPLPAPYCPHRGHPGLWMEACPPGPLADPVQLTEDADGGSRFRISLVEVAVSPKRHLFGQWGLVGFNQSVHSGDSGTPDNYRLRTRPGRRPPEIYRAARHSSVGRREVVVGDRAHLSLARADRPGVTRARTGDPRGRGYLVDRAARR